TEAFLVELFKHFFVGDFFVHQFSLRFFASNLASIGTARLSFLPLSLKANLLRTFTGSLYDTVNNKKTSCKTFTCESLLVFKSLGLLRKH
ncbi:hypothetical protein, partial [Salmonella enterica]|uniref:hypothetical protein n=1 Tax=Salmonella enterica TaxID=28901 RepID=UPI003F7142B7